VDNHLYKSRCKVDRAALVAQADASAHALRPQPLGYHQQHHAAAGGQGTAKSRRLAEEPAVVGGLLIERQCSFGNATLGVPIPVLPVSFFPEMERVLAASYVVYEEAARALARR
jgi:hypothetical protein